MNRKAIISGREYALLEIVPSLDGGRALLLCEDENGKRAVCSEPLWRSCALTDVQSAPVHAHSSSQEKIEYFLSVFKGREDVYARRYHSTTTGKNGYTPVCKNEWVHSLCDKKKYKCAECPNREFRPLTADVVKAHLIGRDSLCRDVAAIYPMLEDNKTWLLAADFDEENWKLDVTAFCKSCKEAGLVPAVERSRSGNGAHVWFFFSEPVSAADARRLGTGLLTGTMSCRHELSFSSYDRLFPSQDLVPKGGFGNLIALPFQGQAQKDGNSLFVDDRFEPYPDQWAFLSSLPKITPEQLEEALRKVCHHGDMGELADAEEKQVPWKRKRTKTKLTRRDFPLQVRLHHSNLIYVEKKGFSQGALNTLKRLAAFPNPEFRSKQAMRISVYGVPRVLDCGYEDEEYIGLPRGCMDEILGLLDQYEVPVVLEDHRSPGHSIDVEFNGVLRPEQEPAARALLDADTGVLSATTAFGKTVIGSYLIGQRKVNTLVLVQSSALLEQWKSSLEQFLNIHEVLPEPPKKRGRKKKQHLIGQIGSGKNTRSGIVDIATMQSLLEGGEKSVKSFVAEYGMVIVDECHHVAAFTFETVLKAVEAKYVYGLSATPVRKDGHHPIIFMQCGPVRYLVDAKSQAEKRSFSHIVIPRFTRLRLPDANGIQDMYAGVIENHNRNELLVSDTLKLIQEGRTPILLTERKEHAVLLAGHLSDQVKHVFLLIGSDKQKDKREKLTALQNVPDDIMTPLEMEDYLDAAERLGYLPMFMLALTAGLRQGELIALKWSDLNMKKRTLTIAEKRAVERRKLVEYGSQTRSIRLTPEVVDLLIMEHSKHPSSPLMFMHPATLKPYSPQMVRRMHKEIIIEAGLDHIRFTDLRHTCAIASLRNGMEAKELAQMLGHARTSMTRQNYTPYLPHKKKKDGESPSEASQAELKQAANILDNLLKF